MSKIAPPPDAADAPALQQIRYAMQLAALEAIKARMPGPNIPFSPQQVIAIYAQRDREPGMWFVSMMAGYTVATANPTTQVQPAASLDT